MESRSLSRHIVEQSCAKDDVGKLTDGREGEPAFQIVLSQGDQRRDNNGEGGKPAEHLIHI